MVGLYSERATLAQVDARVGTPFYNVGWCGDSFMAGAHLSAAGYNSYLETGIANWAGVLSGQAVRCYTSNTFAESGITAREWIDDGYLAQALAANCDAYVLHIGSNDLVIAGRTVAQIKADYRQVAEGLLAKGRPVYLFALFPRTDLSTALDKQFCDMNRFIRELSQEHGLYRFIDCSDLFVNNSATASQPISGLLYDGIHPNAKGCYQIAKRVLQVMYPDLKSRHLTQQSWAADVYDATHNPRGNLATNGLLFGTSGTKTFGTGNLADGKTSNAYSATIGSFAMALSKPPRTEWGQAQWQQIVFSGTPTDQCYAWIEDTSAITGYADGDTLEGFMDFELFPGHSGLVALGLQIEDTGQNFSSYIFPEASGWYDLYENDEVVRGTLRTPPHAVTGASSGIKLKPLFVFYAGVAAAAKVNIGALSLNKV